MTPEAEEYFQNLESLTESSRKVERLAREIISEVDKVDAEHKRIGFTGMAHRAEVCQQADPERCDRLRDEYTAAALASAKALLELQDLIIGIALGMNATMKAKTEMEN